MWFNYIFPNTLHKSTSCLKIIRTLCEPERVPQQSSIVRTEQLKFLYKYLFIHFAMKFEYCLTFHSREDTLPEGIQYWGNAFTCAFEYILSKLAVQLFIYQNQNIAGAMPIQCSHVLLVGINLIKVFFRLLKAVGAWC